MKLTSPAFEHSGVIPKKYGRDFENVNPPLAIEDVPVGTVSLALFMDDPDVPEAAGVPVWDHWVVFNISPNTRQIIENWSVTGTRGVGTRGELNYGGPRPPDREHRYFFKLYALDTMLDLSEGASKQDVLDAMEGHIIEQAELMGTFAPQNSHMKEDKTYYLSYLMGADKISNQELFDLGVEIKDVTNSGNRKLVVPSKKVDEYLDLVEKKMTNGFWNEVVGEGRIIFLFKLEDGAVKRYVLSPENEQEVDDFCAKLNNEPPDKTANVYKYISENEFYNDFMIKYYADMIHRKDNRPID